MCCSTSSTVVDHKWKATCSCHLEDLSHIEKKKKLNSTAVSSAEKQATVTEQETRKMLYYRILYSILEHFYDTGMWLKEKSHLFKSKQTKKVHGM